MSRAAQEPRLRTATEADELARRVEELKAVLAEPSPKEQAERELRAVEVKLAETRKAEGKAAAAERLLGIKRALGSLLDVYDGDATHFVKMDNARTEAVQRANARYETLVGLLLEAKALAEHFGLPTPELPHILPPARDQRFRVPPCELSDWSRVLPQFEKDETGLRSRRSYGEIADSEGYRIITASGLPPFAELNPAQQRLLRAQESEAREEQRQQAALPNMSAVAHLPLGAEPL